MCNKPCRHGWRGGRFKQVKLQYQQGCCGHGRYFISAGSLICFCAVCETSVGVEFVCLMASRVRGRVKSTARR